MSHFAINVRQNEKFIASGMKKNDKLTEGERQKFEDTMETNNRSFSIKSNNSEDRNRHPNDIRSLRQPVSS